MNTSPLVRFGTTVRFASVPPVLVGLLAISSPRFAHGAEASDPAGAGPPESAYVVFAGLDVFVDDHGTRRPVVGGSETEVLIWHEQQDSVVSLHDVALSAAVEPKVTRFRVTIAALKGYAVYSPARDPAAAAHDQQAFLNNLEGARAEESEIRARTAQAVADSFSGVAPSVSSDSPGAASFQAQMDEAMNQASTAMSDMASTYANPIYRDSRVGSPIGEDDFDGFAVAFTVSAPQAVDDAYGMMRLRLRAKGQPGAPVMQAMKMFSLRKLDRKPRKVIVRQFGLPPGFTMDAYEIHVYAGGRELAGNTSPNRVEVNPDEAHQFLILRFVQQHAGANLPAQVAGELLEDVPGVVRDAALANALVNVSLTADGRIGELNPASTAAGTGDAESWPAEIEEELRRVRFLPALVNGRPAESRGTFAVSELFLWP